MNSASKLMLQLQELQFGLLEIQLYLDTHPNDIRAQQNMMQLAQQISLLMPRVEKYYGPLTSFGFSRENPSRWITEPWPWEMMN